MVVVIMGNGVIERRRSSQIKYFIHHITGSDMDPQIFSDSGGLE